MAHTNLQRIFPHVLIIAVTASIGIAPFSSPVARGQSITPALDGTGTQVQQTGNQFNITGGTIAGSNLFHSLEAFGLNGAQVANFLANPQIHNIIGRVVGGDASVINGLIQVLGSNANLYLLNPAGIVFGQEAQLNVPAAFTATTATGLRFGDDRWLEMGADPDYSALIGSPDGFRFDLSSGSIVNLGNLEVNDGEQLTLAGTTVENLGRLSAPGGTINIAAVGDRQVLRISQDGHLLSLDLPLPSESDAVEIAPLLIPEQVTGGEALSHATQMVRLADGTTRLTGNRGYSSNTGLAIASDEEGKGGVIHWSGDVISNRGILQVDGTSGGTIAIESRNFLNTGDLSAIATNGAGGQIQVEFTGTALQTASGSNSVTGTTEGGAIAWWGGADSILSVSGTYESSGSVGGSIALSADIVQLLGTSLDASGMYAGGKLAIGQGKIEATTVNVTSESELRVDALTQGNGGQILVWSNENTSFFGGLSARGGELGGDGGAIEVSSRELLTFGGRGDAGADRGRSGELWLDPKTIIIDEATSPSFFSLIDPNPDTGNEFGRYIAVLDNGNLVVSAPGDDWSVTNAGAVYLFNPSTGELLGQIHGSQPDDRFGNADNITPFSNGNYGFGNPLADVGGQTNAGVVIVADGTTGQAIHRFSGTNTDDRLGLGAIADLGGDRFVFANPNADIAGVQNSGIVIIGDYDTGAEINRISGVNNFDRFGIGDIAVLDSGNFVFGNYWANINGIQNAGTVILADRDGNEISRISGTSSLDLFGNGDIIALTTGNYAFGNSFADANGVQDAGIVIVADGETGHEINRIVGNEVGDGFGSADFAALGNGNFVFGSFLADINGVENSGTVILADGNTGSEIHRTSGTVSGDRFGIGDIIALPNNNYVFGNYRAEINGNDRAGVVILADGNNGTEIGRLTGSNSGDRWGLGDIVALDNGDFIFGNADADIDGKSDAGAVIIADGNTAAELMRVEGFQSGDRLGAGDIFALPNQDYLLTNTQLGEVNIGTANFNRLTYGYFPDREISLTPETITQVTNTGTALRLQANTDILINREIVTENPNGAGGHLTFQAGRSIEINANVMTDDGNLTLIANDSVGNGVIDGERDPGAAEIIMASGVEIDAGLGRVSISLNAGEGLTFNESGTIELGRIQAGYLNVQNQGSILLREPITIPGGDITLTSFNDGITIDILDTSSHSQAGDISLVAQTEIMTEFLNASSASGNGGSVTLESLADITVGAIQAEGATAGGNIAINTEGVFRARDTFTSRRGQNASLSAIADSAPGTIIIQHGGNGVIPFDVGDASVNGTAGVITRGSTIEQTIDLESFLFSHTQDNGGIQIISIPSPTPPPIPTPAPAPVVELPTPIPTPAPAPVVELPTPIPAPAPVVDLPTPIPAPAPVVDLPTPIPAPAPVVDLPTAIPAPVVESPAPAPIPPAIPEMEVLEPELIVGEDVVELVLGTTEIPARNAATVQERSGIHSSPYNDTMEFHSTAELLITEDVTNNSIQIEEGDTDFNPSTSQSAAEISDGSNVTLNREEQQNTEEEREEEQEIVASQVEVTEIEQASVDTDVTARSSSVTNLTSSESSSSARLASNSSESSTPDSSVVEPPEVLQSNAQNQLDGGDLDGATLTLAESFDAEFEDYLGSIKSYDSDSVQQFQERLIDIEKQTNKTTIIVHILSTSDRLDAIAISPRGQLLHHSNTDVTDEKLQQVVEEFRRELSHPRKRHTTSYLKSSQQLYEWLIAPLKPYLEEMGADILVFSMNSGLRSLPIAALHNGEHFLIEEYALGLIPSIFLTDTRYQSLENAQILAFGASEFEGQEQLPAVPLEVKIISEEIWDGELFLNPEFTYENLVKQPRNNSAPAKIIHLATHAQFRSGTSNDSYIQLWNEALSLADIRQLGWNNTPIELLVLSACQTALGDRNAELGFAGLAVQAGVKSALASLWLVNDLATLGFMIEFYQHLKESKTKSEALRAAQISLIQGKVNVRGNQLQIGDRGYDLPGDLQNTDEMQFSHPYYWSGFTMIGSPW